MNTEMQQYAGWSPRVLVAEDDAPLADFLRHRLEAEQYTVQLVQDGLAASERANSDQYQLFILDRNLPKLDAVSVLKHVRRKRPELPILVLTGCTQVEDRILSLDSGADDCLLKPFAFPELMARIRALLRRHAPVPGATLRVADLTLDKRDYRVERAGKQVALSGKEFALLEYLMRNAGQTVTRTMIMESVWNSHLEPSTNLVDVYVKYVRDKVDGPEFPIRLIRTIRGVGYVLSAK